MTEDDDKALDALVEVMKRNPRPLALLGAGTSMDSGYPDWNRLLVLLEAKARGKISPKYQSFLRGLNDPAWQAEEYRRLIGEDAFKGLIASEFAPRGKVGAILRDIVELKFRHLLTTNYDSCIEEAYEAKSLPLQVTDWTEDGNMRRFFIDLSRSGVTPHLVYLHGRYFDPGKVVLTESSYANRYVRSDDASRKLFAILITQPVVFIGFSVNDPDLNHLMREVNARLGAGTPQHFALMGFEVDEQRQLIENRFERKYGIQPVFYRVTRDAQGSEDHSNLHGLLQQLHERVYGALPAPPDAIVTESSDSAGALAADPSFSSPEVSTTLPLDPLDQQKGRWGGKAENNNRRLKVEDITEMPKFCSFYLVVESMDEIAFPLAGEVDFHLHQTFHPDTRVMPVNGGTARLKIKGYGAFTVGAGADAGRTKLELDLSQLDDFPRWFRES
jgi:SIR2-like domain